MQWRFTMWSTITHRFCTTTTAATGDKAHLGKKTGAALHAGVRRLEIYGFNNRAYAAAGAVAGAGAGAASGAGATSSTPFSSGARASIRAWEP